MTSHKHNDIKQPLRLSSASVVTQSQRSSATNCGRFLLVLLCIATYGSRQLVQAQYGSPNLVLSSEALNESPEKVEASRERLTIVAPRRLRPQSDYHIIVSLARSQAPATMDLTITGARDSDREHTETRSIVAQSGETQTVKFSIGDWPSAEYALNVTAFALDKSWNFTQEAQLQYQAKKFSIILQTDKAIYKPGEEVRFRSVFLTPQLNPQHLKNEVNITITDPRRNIVKQWLGESDKSGVISHSMLLSQDPMMGDEWLIRVEAREQTGLKKFQVAEYILPTFDIHIDLPSFATYNESDIVAGVRAVYTYGKPVDGHVTLTVQPKIRYLNLQTRPLDSHQFKGQLDPTTGKIDFQLDLMKDLWLEREHYEREIEFFALVEEKLTGRKYNKTETMFIYEKPIRIDLLNAERTFKPGLPHLFQFRVSYQDGKPVEENGPLMTVRIIGENQELLNTTRLQPSGPGLASFWFDVPQFINRTDLGASEEFKTSQDSTQANVQVLNYLNVQVMYRNQVHHVAQVSGQRTKSNEHLSITLAHQNPTARLDSRNRIGSSNKKPRFVMQPMISVGEELRVQVRSTEPMSLLTCHGMARGDIVWALTREPRNETQYEFTVMLDQRMTPKARVMCFYVREETREIITDLVSFPVNGLFRNNLKLSLSTDEAKPGKQVEIRALTKPNSLVALSAVDESVLLLKSGHDIDQEDLKHETESYGARFSDLNEGFWGAGATSADRLFQQADVIVLTNNNIFNGWEFRSSLDANDVHNAEMLSGRMSTAPLYAANARERIELASSRPAIFSSPDLLNLKENSKRFKESEPVVIRSQFPETWLWENGTTNSQGEVSFEARVPDTITSWHLSGFSLNEEDGFGLSSNKPVLRVFRPFFIKLNLPHSIIRGETLNIQCVVFNYSPKPIQARVTFDNHLQEFEFVEASNEIEDLHSNDQQQHQQQQQSRQVRLEPEQGVSVSFLVRPRRLGHLDVRIVARSDAASSDGIVRKLLVKPEGQTQFMNKAMFLNLDQSSVKRNFSIQIPPNAVAGSQKVFVSAIGDVMGAGLANVDDLLRLPYGCGEQNMINLVPNIVILNYLISTGRLRETQKLRALRNIETGYQRQLNYKRRDGSFSAFGQSDTNGSVWLTAYVLKTFQQARPLIKIDPKVIHRAANYLAHFSMSDGSIQEFGMIHDKRLQSASAHNTDQQSQLYLTAYTMIALFQDSIPTQEHELHTINGKPLDEIMQKGIDFLESQLNSRASSLSTYDVAIVTYALQLAGRQASAARGYQLLWAEARDDPQTGGVWWANQQVTRPSSHSNSGGSDGLESESLNGKLVASEASPGNQDSETSPLSTVQPPLIPIKANKKHSAHLFLPESLSIEMTSFALLSTIRRGELDRALPIVKWLVGQQNSQGGFASTQDTVLAIEALGAFASATAEAAKSKQTSIEVEITYPRVGSNNNGSRSASLLLRRNNVEQLLITNSNEFVHQQLRLTTNNNDIINNASTTITNEDDLIKWVQVEANGSGSGVVQVSWQYNLLVSAEKPAFYLNPYVDRASNINYLQLSICTYYKQAGEASNMALVDIELPSGYLADLDALPSLKGTREVKRIDTSDGDTRVLVYLDRVTNDELCFTVPAHRGAKVSNNKPVPVTIYDYYDRHKAARIFYEPILARSCDICDSDSCSKGCENQKLPLEANTFKSLHDQRKSANNNKNKTNDKLRQASGSEGAHSNLSRLLPLAPVLMTLISLFK